MGFERFHCPKKILKGVLTCPKHSLLLCARILYSFYLLHLECKL
uniref:Uncharacterized protein n=1 Tax=Utricularia reniformis TaxID=192314 RepID=A0A1Y0B2F6_9LAMI|nr:hypothetical protein AEK19_MT1385 [Utricularia reniformis]ART31581.1 hypothetical protein AEK19_MT1385 [Utricularia reniformis]